MSLLSRLFARQPVTVPEWASFFSAQQYRLFESAVFEHWQRRQYKVRLDEGCLHVEGIASPFGLLNLAQLCLGVEDQRQWPLVIADHFERLQRAVQPSALQQDFAQMRSLLKLRLYPASALQALGDLNGRARSDLEGTESVLVLDLPDSVVTLSPEAQAAWPLDNEALFALALTNLAADQDLHTGVIDLGGISVQMIASDSFFAASQVLRLAALEGFVGPYGALVAVPNRHVLLSYPINDAEVLMAVQKLLPVALRMYRDGPGSISQSLYWYHDGQFTCLPCAEEDNKLLFMPPESFTDLLQKLAQRH